MHKKGMTLWEVIVWAVILLVVAVLLIYMFRNLLGAQADDIEDRIGSTGDGDGDLVPNAFDRCPESIGDVDAKGCTYQCKNNNGNCLAPENCNGNKKNVGQLSCGSSKICCV
jgi:hypothetical protein